MGERWSQANPVRRGDVWVRREGEETAVYDPETGRLHVLNPTALAIWELCDGTTTPQEMIEAVVELTGAAPDLVARDVRATLEQLGGLGLIE